MTRDEATASSLCVWGGGNKTPKHLLRTEPVCGGERFLGTHYCQEHVAAAYGGQERPRAPIYVIQKRNNTA